MKIQLLDELLQKEMDRREFLIYTGLLFLAITGITSRAKHLSTIVQEKPQKGFGAGPYGK